MRHSVCLCLALLSPGCNDKSSGGGSDYDSGDYYPDGSGSWSVTASSGSIQGTFTYYDYETSDECEAVWKVGGTGVRAWCPDCDLTLDWAYDVTYMFSEGDSYYAGACALSEVAAVAGNSAAYTADLEEYIDFWGFTGSFYGYSAPEGYGGFFVIGYAYRGFHYFYPAALARVSGDTFTWDTSWWYSYYYSYYYDYDYTPVVGFRGDATLR